jgi:1,2-diacylglycerol 3-beta-galactosyltransferase
MVVSLVPNFNRALFRSLELALPGVPFVTVLTDLADCPPHFWIERQPQYLICGTQRAMEQAAAMGYGSSQVFRTSGMILRPQFYDAPDFDRVQERGRLGLRPDLPVALVLFGGQGSNVMYSIAERLGNSLLDLQLILICGRNAKLRERLKRLHSRNIILVEGFTKEIPRYMRLADFFIGKPGPGSISEAIQMKLPVIVERNAWTLPQERYNTDWVLSRA